ncbi:hypothetical protein [Candidatus Palauibacter sp.]|uniref:hypothetical protein n=1 Tax=Candidatus Palauibacter sp. TaxID=3101350 RepID=UPI003D0E6C81
MIGIFAGSAAEARTMSSVAGTEARVFRTVSELAEDGRGIECLVFSSRGRSLAARLDLLREIERKLPWVPVILVADREIAIAPVLSRVKVADLVWFEDVGRELAPRIEAARGVSALLQLSEKIRRSGAPPALRAAIVHSLRQARNTPVRNVKELAAAVGCSPVTLFQQFGARASGRTTFSRFLGALAIMRAQQLRALGISWKRVAEQVGLSRGTLARRSNRWPGCTLSELDRIAPDQLLAAFASEHVAPLLDEGP